MHPNWFPSIWYVPHNLCTYLASRFALLKTDQTYFQFERFYLRVHQVCPKWFVSLWCMRRKPCTYFAPKLTLSPKRLKRESIWHTSSRSSIGCVQIDFWPYVTFHANRAPILHQDQHYLQTDPNELPLEPLHLGVTSGASTVVSKSMVH